MSSFLSLLECTIETGKRNTIMSVLWQQLQVSSWDVSSSSSSNQILSPSHKVCRGRQKLQGCSICRWPVSILCTTIWRIINIQRGVHPIACSCLCHPPHWQERKPQASKEISLLIICSVFFLHHLLLLCRIRH